MEEEDGEGVVCVRVCVCTCACTCVYLLEYLRVQVQVQGGITLLVNLARVLSTCEYKIELNRHT